MVINLVLTATKNSVKGPDVLSKVKGIDFDNTKEVKNNNYSEVYLNVM